MMYWLGLMYKRLLVILYMVQSLASALLCSRVGQERAEAKVDPNVSQLCLSVLRTLMTHWPRILSLPSIVTIVHIRCTFHNWEIAS